MKIACLTQPAIPVMATAPDGCELVGYTYENPFPIGRTAIQICDLIVAAVGIQAIEDGCDAIVINTLADFGAAILKEVARGPVVAAGYAAFTAAAALGSGRFSIVSIWPPATGLVVQERLREYGAAQRCVTMRHCISDEEAGQRPAHKGETFAHIASCDASYMTQMSQAIDAAMAEDSIDSIILGCTCMSPTAARLGDRAGVPVLDATQTAVDLAVSLGSQHGPVTLDDSRTDRFWAGSMSSFVGELGQYARELHARSVGTKVGSR
jgi:Asp/Glu/hydantoin racemase